MCSPSSLSVHCLFIHFYSVHLFHHLLCAKHLLWICLLVLDDSDADHYLIWLFCPWLLIYLRRICTHARMFALQTPLLPSVPGKDCDSDVKVIESRSWPHLLIYFPLKLQPSDNSVPSATWGGQWKKITVWKRKMMSPNGFRTAPNVTDERHSKGMHRGKWELEWWLLLMTGDVLEKVPRQNTKTFFQLFLWTASNLHLLWLPRGALRMHQLSKVIRGSLFSCPVRLIEACSFFDGDGNVSSCLKTATASMCWMLLDTWSFTNCNYHVLNKNQQPGGKWVEHSFSGIVA